jgi:Ni2+-binding GTPase involved in maturation of urease and hydrogenase
MGILTWIGTALAGAAVAAAATVGVVSAAEGSSTPDKNPVVSNTEQLVPYGE